MFVVVAVKKNVSSQSMNYQLHTVNKLAEIAPFGEWLIDMSQRDELVGVALRERQEKLAFSTREDGWILDLKSVAGPLALGVLRTQLLNQSQLKLAARNLASDLSALCKFLASQLDVSEHMVYLSASPAFVADLTSAAKCINQTVTPAGKFRNIEHDAYEIALLEPQFAHGICPYYQKIGIPLAKAVAETALTKKGGDADWWVTYEHLWVKVLAFYTGDPTLTWALHEGRDPIETIAAMLKVPPEMAENLLLCQTCGRDMASYTRRFRAELPDDLDTWLLAFDRALPSLSAACAGMQRAYWERRTITTLYGRTLRPGNPMGEAVAFRVFGTVEDIIGIAATTFWNNRTSNDILLTRLDGGPAANIIRVCGVGPKDSEKYEWQRTLKTLAPPADPLGAGLLKPTLV